MNEEELNKKLLDDLKNLHKIEAPKNFETDLWRKINSSDVKKKQGFWERFFTPAKLAPAAIALASAVIIFFVVDGNSEVMEDPLSIEPRIREDIFMTETLDEVEPQIETQTTKKENKSLQRKVEQKDFEESDNLESGRSIEDLSNEVFDSEKGLIANEFESKKTLTDSNDSDENRRLGANPAPTVVTTGSQEISKNSLNFMQRGLSTQEENEIKQLKLKVTNQKNVENEQNSDKMP